MERYIPKPKGRIFKTILFVIVVVGIFLFFRYDIHKKIFGSGKKDKNVSNGQNEKLEKKFEPLTQYDIKNFPPQRVKNIKQQDWLTLIQKKYNISYVNARRMIYYNNIYDIVPRWCWIVSNNVSIKKIQNNYYLVFELRKSDKTYFKLKDSEQIYAATTPTLQNVKVKVYFYGVENKTVVLNIPPVTLKSDSQQPYKKIRLKITPDEISGYKFLIIDIKGFKYFVFI